MAFSLDMLRNLLGLGDSAPGAAATAAVPAVPPAAPQQGASPDASSPDPATAAQQQLTLPQGGDMSIPASAWPALPQISAGPALNLPSAPTGQAQAQAQAQPQALPQALPQLPTKQTHGWLVNAIDKGLLGGAIGATDQQSLNKQLAAYQQAQMQQFYSQLPTPELKSAFVADPTGFLASWEGNIKNVQLKPGETNLSPGTGAETTAPQFDEKSGTFVRPGAGASLQQTPSAGGDFSVSPTGVIASGRTGQVAGRVALPQVLGPEQRIGTVTPGVTPAGGLPQAGQPEQPAGAPPLQSGSPVLPQRTPMVSPAAVLAAAPGATITSGYRDPQHNAAVGGVPTSWHTAGTPDAPGAVDLTPPQGMSMGDLASAVTAKLPQVRVLNEGNHVHVQPNARNTSALPQQGAPAQPRVAADGSVIDEGTKPPPVWSPPVYNPQTNRMEQTNKANGEVKDAGASAFDPQKAKQDLTSSEQIKDYSEANDAYKAMISAAAQPNGGMRAYALRDTFARTVNPKGAVRVGTIEALKEAQGIPATVKSYFMNLKGDGDVPPEIAQQILDVSRGFLAGHYSSAKALNDSYAAQASRYGVNPADATVPMDQLPGHVHLSLPPQKSMIQGDIYKTLKGMGQWTGTGFKRYGG